MPYFIIVTITLLLDQLTKQLIAQRLSLFESIEVIPGFFNLTYVTNRGAAFSILADVDSWWRHPFFILVGVAALSGLTLLYFRMRREAPVQSIGLALIAGGALGNLIDRIRVGAVIDFIDVHWSGYHWPAFNIADSAICIGVGIFLIFSFIEKENKQ
jgi:signal peptidase II